MNLSMPIDAVTMLLMTQAIALVAALVLAAEWRLAKVRSLAWWSAGFATIVVGSGMSVLRTVDSFLLYVWLANGLLVVAHLLFAKGAAAFAGRRLPGIWLNVLLVWVALLGTDPANDRTALFGLVNSALVAILSLKAASLLLSLRRTSEVRDAVRLGHIFLGHGIFYLAKSGLIFMPGLFVSLVGFKGLLIKASLYEGILVEVSLALLMLAAVRHRRERQITALAERDSLTGAYNRRAFEAKAAAGMALARRAGQPVALLLCDVDHFKAVNDGFGHATGDRLLSGLAAILTDCVPADALVARLGGDEFAVLLFGLPPENLPALGRRICHRFAQSGAGVAGASLQVSTSIGAAASITGTEELPHLFDRADRALYDAKRKGRDRMSVESGVDLSVATPPLRLAKVASRA